MPTLKQRKLAEEIVKEAKGKRIRNAGKLLEDIGYAKSTSEAIPGKIIASEGVREALNDLGFSEDGAKKVVASILYSAKSKDHDKLDAADKIFKVHGSYAPDRHLNVNVEVEALPEIKELAEKLNAIYRGTGIGSDGIEPSSVGDQAQDKE